MSLVTQFRGDIKSGKTLSGIYWTRRMAQAIGLDARHIWSTMDSLTYKPTGERWGTQIDLDELLLDIQITDVNDAKYKEGIIFVDEAHTILAGQLTNNLRGLGILAMIAQAGKRGLLIIYTSHLSAMMAPKVIELTQRSIKCYTHTEGRTVLWKVTDPRAVREAYDEGYPPPAPVTKLLTRGDRQYPFYDTNEIIDPWGAFTASGATPTMRKLMKSLEAKRL